MESAGTLDDQPSNQLILQVLYATVLEPDLLQGVVDVPPERVRLIEKNGIVRPPAEPVPGASPIEASAAPRVEPSSTYWSSAEAGAGSADHRHRAGSDPG